MSATPTIDLSNFTLSKGAHASFEDGSCAMELRSIAFHSMDQQRFARLFERALFVICSDYLAGSDAEEIRQQVFAVVDGPAATALGRRAA